MSNLMLLVLAMVADPAAGTKPRGPATVKMSSSVGETHGLDRALGIQRVRTFEEFVNCIRTKNSDDDVKAFTVEKSRDAKVGRFSALTKDCWTAPGANLDLDFEALDRALRGERQTD